MKDFHSSPTTCHSIFDKSYKDIISRSLGGIKSNLQDFVVTCDTFQRNKVETVKTLGELQPLPIQTHIWDSIFMDCIVGLPRDGKKSMIIDTIDHISKYAHFSSLLHPFPPSLVSQVFMESQIFNVEILENLANLKFSTIKCLVIFL